MATGDSHHELKRLHDRHGPIVCIAPKLIDIDMPELIQTIFNTKGDWPKVRTNLIADGIGSMTADCV